METAVEPACGLVRVGVPQVGDGAVDISPVGPVSEGFGNASPRTGPVALHVFKVPRPIECHVTSLGSAQTLAGAFNNPLRDGASKTPEGLLPRIQPRSVLASLPSWRLAGEHVRHTATASSRRRVSPSDWGIRSLAPARAVVSFAALRALTPSEARSRQTEEVEHLPPLLGVRGGTAEGEITDHGP